MKKLAFLLMVLILSSCGNSGVSLVNNLGKENNLSYEKDVFKDGTKWYRAKLPANGSNEIILKIKNSIDKKLDMLPSKTVKDELSTAQDYSAIEDTYIWESPKMKLEMRYTRDVTYSEDLKYFITFWVTQK